MIALTCAITGRWVYFNPERILVLEDDTIGSCRVHVAFGDDEYFVVKETAAEVHFKIEEHFKFRARNSRA